MEEGRQRFVQKSVWAERRPFDFGPDSEFERDVAVGQSDMAVARSGLLLAGAVGKADGEKNIGQRRDFEVEHYTVAEQVMYSAGRQCSPVSAVNC